MIITSHHVCTCKYTFKGVNREVEIGNKMILILYIFWGNIIQLKLLPNVLSNFPKVFIRGTLNPARNCPLNVATYLV